MSPEEPVKLRFEICVDSVESALAAQQAGAHRVELCDNLLEGGTTPSAGMIEIVRQSLDIDLNILIRPRGGDFCYTEAEFRVMERDIAIVKELGVNGVVIGILNPDGSVDKSRTAHLIEQACPMSVTFHRAFDMTRDPLAALEDVIALGVDRVLTSGQEVSALEGLDLITELVKRAGDRIIIMAGGGITERNIAKIVRASGVQEVHFSARVQSDSPMSYRNTRAYMGGVFRPPEFSRAYADPDRIRACMTAARKGQGMA